MNWRSVLKKLRRVRKFTIRYKFLAVTSLLLACCVALYLTIAVSIFKSDKQELVFDLNRSMVTNIASELETQFASLSDKIEIFAMAGYKKELKKDFVEDLIQRNSEIVFVSFWKQQDGKIEQSYTREDFLKTYGLDAQYFTQTLLESRKKDLSAILKEGEEVWNATLPNGPPLFGYARSVSIEDETGRPIDRVAVLAYVNASKLLKTVSAIEKTQIFVATKTGEVIVHPDPIIMQQNALKATSSVFEKALASPLKTSVVQSRVGDDDILGAFSKIFGGRIVVVAETNGKKAFSVVDDLIRRSLIFSLIVLTLAFLAAVLFSRSLTRPLETLTDAMDRVADGDLTIQTQIRTKDEIEFLSNAFNQMISDLRESRQELEEINRELENKVKERTLQLEKQNQAVKEAQEALLKTTRLAAVGEIAGRAAHEVLNPLTSMMTRLENVQKRLDLQEKSYLGVLHDIKSAWAQDYSTGGFDQLMANWKKPSSVQQGSNLWEEDIQNINKILESWRGEIQSLLKDSSFLMNEGERINKIVSRMRSFSVVKSSTDLCFLAELGGRCHDIMADLMEKHSIEFRVEGIDSNLKVQIDKDEFVQSLTNLLRNSLQAVVSAKKMNPKHQGFVVVHASVEGGTIQLFIEDNGVGIEKDDQTRLFETQFSTKSKEEGTGLGLNISRRFLRAANGDIEFIDSIPLKRTVFKITLPIAQTQESAA